MINKKPKFKVGDTIWYISDYGFHNPIKGKIKEIQDEEGDEIIVRSKNGDEYVYVEESCVSKTKKESFRQYLEGQIECTKDSIKREKDELLKLQIKLAKCS
jgi:hypothetical protein